MYACLFNPRCNKTFFLKVYQRCLSAKHLCHASRQPLVALTFTALVAFSDSCAYFTIVAHFARIPGCQPQSAKELQSCSGTSGGFAGTPPKFGSATSPSVTTAVHYVMPQAGQKTQQLRWSIHFCKKKLQDILSRTHIFIARGKRQWYLF